MFEGVAFAISNWRIQCSLSEKVLKKWRRDSPGPMPAFPFLLCSTVPSGHVITRHFLLIAFLNEVKITQSITPHQTFLPCSELVLLQGLWCGVA